MRTSNTNMPVKKAFTVPKIKKKLKKRPPTSYKNELHEANYFILFVVLKFYKQRYVYCYSKNIQNLLKTLSFL